MRTTAFVLSTSIALVLFAVLFQTSFWTFSQSSSSSFTAQAASIPPPTPAAHNQQPTDSDDVVRAAQQQQQQQQQQQKQQQQNASSDQPPSPRTSSSPQADNASSHQTTSIRRSRAKTFLVVFMGHSGSTAFTTELRQHTEFLVEKLEPLDHDEYEFNTELALQKARQIMERGIQQQKIPGFKIRPFHILNKPQLWKRFVRTYDCRIIWQYRENIIKQSIGEYRNRYLNDTSVVEGLSTDEQTCDPSSDQRCTFRIDDMRFLHSLMNSMSSSDELLASAVRTLERNGDMSIVRYEDYLYRRERTMRETFDFLGVDWQQTAPQRKKASPDNLCKMVKNFEELCDRFLPCLLWRPYLYDDVNNCRCKPGNWTNFDPSFCKRNSWFQKE